MRMKITFKDMQLNNTPLERLVFDSNSTSDKYILLDDVNEKRWKVKIKVFQAIKITTIDCVDFDYRKGGEFPDVCFEDKKGYPVPQFRAHIMEVESSDWIKELTASLKVVDSSADFMGKARHFLIPCYDNIIEIIAWNLELVEAEQEILK